MQRDLKGRHLEGEVILWAVRRYRRYRVSHRELEEMLAERGVHVDHTTLYRWVRRYAPEIEARLRRKWRVGETYVRVRGRWAYLCRAVDEEGRTLDSYLSPTRSAKAAERFLGKAIIRACKARETPVTLTTDKAPTYPLAVAELRREGRCPPHVAHRRARYLNDRIEADHGQLKRLIRPTSGFKSIRTAYATVKGFEAMRALEKGQGGSHQIRDGIRGEVRLVERVFGIGPDVLTEVVARLRVLSPAA